MGKLLSASSGGAGLSFGTIPDGNISISMVLAPLGSDINQNGIIGLHEAAHGAGGKGGNYDDRVLAQAADAVAFANPKKFKNVGHRPNTPDVTLNSYYITNMLFANCRR